MFLDKRFLRDRRFIERLWMSLSKSRKGVEWIELKICVGMIVIWSRGSKSMKKR
jgi:hypothetical protein